MISRRRTNTPPNEVLQQASITGASGIDITRPITANNIADKIVNFDLDYDGSLVLRKPLIEKDTYNTWLWYPEPEIDENGDPIPVEPTEESIVAIKYLYDKKNRLLIIKNVNLVTNVVKYALIIANEKNDSWFQPVIRFTDITGKDVDTPVPTPYKEQRVAYWNLENPKIFNTNTSTIIGNCTVDLTADIFAKELDPDENIIHEAIYNPLLLEEAYAKTAPRYLQIFYEVTSEQWVVRVVTPEMNTLEFSEDIIFNPNTTLDASYALRDNYFASLPTVKNITAYAEVLEQNKKLIFNPELDTQTILSANVNGATTNVYNPTYWNGNSSFLTNFPDWVLMSFTTEVSNFVDYRFNFKDSSTIKIPKRAIKQINVSFIAGGQIQSWWGAGWNSLRNISASRQSGYDYANSGDYLETFNFRVRYVPVLTSLDINPSDQISFENGYYFREACTDYGGNRNQSCNSITGATLRLNWKNCRFQCSITIILKNDVQRTFTRSFGI